MFGSWKISRDHPLLIEFNDQIMFEASDDLDEDDQELYERRLAKPLSTLKVRDFCVIQV